MNARYPITMIAIHWLVALLVLVAYFSGGNPVRHGFQGEIHAASGVLIALLFLIRLLLRVAFRRRLPQHTLAAWQYRLAQTVQILLYGCMLLIPLSGWLALSGKTEAYSFFGLNLPLFQSAALAEFEMGDMHELLANGFMVLAGLHAVAALAHHFFWKDDVLKSMSPHSR